MTKHLGFLTFVALIVFGLFVLVSAPPAYACRSDGDCNGGQGECTGYSCTDIFDDEGNKIGEDCNGSCTAKYQTPPSQCEYFECAPFCVRRQSDNPPGPCGGGCGSCQGGGQPPPTPAPPTPAPAPRNCPGGITCSGTVTGSPGEVVCSPNGSNYQCNGGTGTWVYAGSSCSCPVAPPPPTTAPPPPPSTVWKGCGDACTDSAQCRKDQPQRYCDGVCKGGTCPVAPPPPPTTAAPPPAGPGCVNMQVTCCEPSWSNNCPTSTVCCPAGSSVKCYPAGCLYSTPYVEPVYDTPYNTPYTTPIFPWIQTSGGDVHSNTNINTPGGP